MRNYSSVPILLIVQVFHQALCAFEKKDCVIGEMYQETIALLT